MIDLHVHSTCSDGTLSPTELVDYAIQKGLSAFALTDHDCVEGLDTILSYAKSLPNAPEIIPGIELSTDENGQEVHMVGLFIDHHNPEFNQYLQEFIESRTTRNKKMCHLLQEHGMNITYEELEAEFPGAVLTRAHYAKLLMKHGYVKSIKEAFERFLGDHCPCYVSREKITPVMAIDLIRKAGGLAILAHPILYHMSDARLDALVQKLKEAGLTGIEAIYSTYSPAEERQIRKLAAKYDLLLSGGSDFHGENKPGLDLGTGYGKLYVPEEVLLALKKARIN
ncbi:MAG: PHP domain-containing protein [Acetatifactor sp.]